MGSIIKGLQLNSAISFADIKLIEKILERGADINSSSEGKTPLHVAVKKGNLEIVEFLLNHGAYVNDVSTSSSEKDYTSLHFAAMKGYDRIVNLLLSKGANINAMTENGETPLHIAASFDSKKSNYQAKILTVKLLLDKGADVHCKRKDELTPLLVSIKARNELVVKMLLRKGANVDDQDHHGKTALYLAVEIGCLAIVKELLKYSPNIKIQNNFSPIITAVMSSSSNILIADAILNYGFSINPEDVDIYIHPNFKEKTPLHAATEKGWLRIVEFLLNHGANVNWVSTSSSEKGYTALHLAVMNGYYNIVELLLSKGANINATAANGETALHAAAHLDSENPKFNMQAKIVKLLLAKGADVHCKRRDELTPLLVAIITRNEIVVRMLLQNGANVDDKDSEGNTALYLAVEEKSLPIVKDILKYCPRIDIQSNRESLINAIRSRYCGDIVGALVDYGFALNLEDANNAQLFHNAIWMGSFTLVEWFLKNGANPNVLDCTGDTPLHTAAENKSKKAFIDHETDIYAKNVNTAIGELLISYGADINAKSRNGKTVIISAIKEYNLELIKLLLTHGAYVKNCLRLLAAPLYKNSKEEVEAIFPYLNINAILSTTIIHVYYIRDTIPFEEYRSEDVKILIIIDNIIKTSKCGFSNFLKTLLYYGADVNILYDSLDFYYRTEQAHVPLRLSDWSSYEDKFEEFVDVLQRHILKLKIAKLYVNEQNLKLISQVNEQLNDFEEECKEEISKMKNNQIKNTGITFFEILGNDTNRLAKYMKNENILKALKLGKYKTEYPMYARMIELNFIKAMKRKELVDQANLVFNFVFKYFNELPNCVTVQILDYLSDEDLQKLLLAFKYCDVNRLNTHRTPKWSEP